MQWPQPFIFVIKFDHPVTLVHGYVHTQSEVHSFSISSKVYKVVVGPYTGLRDGQTDGETDVVQPFVQPPILRAA